MTDSETPYPARKRLNHEVPFGVDAASAFFFVTVCATERDAAPFVPLAEQILDSVRFRQSAGIWFVSLFLVMPDHAHMLVHVPPHVSLADVIGNWKHYLAHRHGLSFQRDFFETRIRDDAHYAEKWDYIVRNPVARGLVATPREWPHVIAFDRATGLERPHR